MKTRRDRDGQWKLLFVLGLAAMAVLFTSIHSVIYNWVFLPRYANTEVLPRIISPELIAAYWNWMPGRVLCVVNAALVVGSLTLPWYLFREPAED